MNSDELSAWRKRLGLTVPKAAVALGLSESSLRAMLYGHRTITERTATMAAMVEAQKS